MSENGVLDIVYVEFNDDRPPFAWRAGQSLSREQSEAREQIHREFIEVVRQGKEKHTADGRVVRHGARLLVESFVTAVGSVPERLAACLVFVIPPDAKSGWAARMAAHGVEVLRGQGLTADPEALQRLLAEGGRNGGRTDPRTARRALQVAAGLALVVLCVWLVRKGLG